MCGLFLLKHIKTRVTSKVNIAWCIFFNQKFKRESWVFFQPSLLNTYDFQYNNIKLRLPSLDIEVLQQIKEYYYHYYKLTDSLNIAIHFSRGLVTILVKIYFAIFNDYNASVRHFY